MISSEAGAEKVVEAVSEVGAAALVPISGVFATQV